VSEAGLAGRRLARDPHAVLGAAVALILGAEYLREVVRAVPWFPVEVAIATAALALVWHGRDRIRLGPLLLVALCLQVGWALVRVHHTLGIDHEWQLYAGTGDQLLHGHYPRSEYPVGAVLLFAVEAALRGTETHLVNALVMVPFQLAAIAGVWSLRTRWSSWFAAVLAVWPANAWFWEKRFDLAPTGLLVAGLALAARRRFGWAGVVLALGAVVKWSPGVAVLALLAYLIALRQARGAIRLAAGFVLTLAIVHVPFLVWSPGNVWAAYSRQGGRSITDESLWHLPLRALGLEGRHGYAEPSFVSVEPPRWADVAAVAVQILAVLALVWVASRVPTLNGAVAVAALVPVVFLVTNRVFSVQYFVLLLAAWAAAGALVARDGHGALTVTTGALGATLASALIVPYPIHRAHVWEGLSAVRFALALWLTVWLARGALASGRSPASRGFRIVKTGKIKGCPAGPSASPQNSR
jgi:hypothetical protein